VLVTAAVSPAGALRAHSSLITAKSAILIDNQTGEILWQRNPDWPLPPASTTKIVTAMLALQSGRLDESLSVTPEAAQAPPSKISLRPGWRMRLRDLVYALLLNSANDASVVIAEGLSGSVRSFAERMNAQARAMGATNSHFVNPNGLPAADHYSTARDLATMFGQAMRNPLFASIVNTKTITVWPTWGSKRQISLHTHNRLLGNYRIHVVGKTGWTIAAKKCFVGAATADGRELVVAVLGSRDLWGDLKRLIEFGFNGSNPPLADGVDVEAAAPPGPAPSGDDDADDAADAPARSYAVRVATFRNLVTAARLRDSIARQGFPAKVAHVRKGQQRVYQVSIGGYTDRAEAQWVATRVKRAHRNLAPIVVASN